MIIALAPECGTGQVLIAYQLQTTPKTELKSIFADGDNHATQIGRTLRQTWEDDKQARQEKAQLRPIKDRVTIIFK